MSTVPGRRTFAKGGEGSADRETPVAREGLRVEVRPYEASDRERLRHICCATGFMGEPIHWQWRDIESWADIFTGYYTDCEPESALVAVLDARVVGYLLGCVDSRRAWSPARVGLRHGLCRGIAFRPGTAAMVWRTLGDGVVDGLRGRLSARPFSDQRWPAHLHVNLLEEARGTGTGSTLVRRWLESLRAMGVRGCHLQTIAENASAVAFFEAMGFSRHGEKPPLPGIRARDGSRLHGLTMVQDL